MTFLDLRAGVSVFLDANPIVYHFAPHPTLAPACAGLFERIEQGEIRAFTSTHILSEAAHRLMTYEASRVFGWTSKIVERLKQHPDRIAQLTDFRTSIENTIKFGVQVLTVPPAMIDAAASVSQQTGLLTNDALLVAVMQAHGLANLASHDADFDRVPGLTRYAPV